MLQTRKLFFCCILAAQVLFSGSADAADNTNTYEGDLVVKALSGGRNLKLVEPFSFIDDKGRVWEVPKGTVVNGASIPSSLWSFMGGPFSGKYREASVIHDHYCDLRKGDWEAVHRVFYDAMIASGVAIPKAQLMYWAVYRFGPRWDYSAGLLNVIPEFGGGVLTFDPTNREAPVPVPPVSYRSLPFNQDELVRIESIIGPGLPVQGGLELLRRSADNSVGQVIRNHYSKVRVVREESGIPEFRPDESSPKPPWTPF